MCLSECGVRLAGFVCFSFPFICLPLCVSLSGGVCLAGLVCALSPFICLFLQRCMSFPEWWCPPLRSCLCLVSLYVFRWVVVTASPVLFVPCLPSFVSLYSAVCVSLSGGVRLAGFASPVLFVPCLPLFVSFYSAVCVSLSGGVRLSGLVCASFPFMCFAEWWLLPRRSCLCLVCLYLSPFICLSEWWCPPRGLVCLLSRFIYLPLFVSLYVSPWVVVSAFPVLSLFIYLLEWWCPLRRSCLCFVSLYLSPLMRWSI